MITCIIALVQQSEWLQIIGYITAGLEVVLVLIKFMQYLVNPDSKLGKFLSKLLKGVKFLKDTTDKANDDIKENKDNGRKDE